MKDEYELIACDLTDVLVEYVRNGLTIEEGVECSLGWAIGTAIREYHWSPEDVSFHVKQLAQRIIDHANEILAKEKPNTH